MTSVEMRRTEKVEEILKKAGFHISERCFSRPSCFDFAARKDEKIIIIKIQQDIGNLSPTDSSELKMISECITASSLLISSKTGGKPLEDDTVYSRYNVLVITPKTLENIVLHKTYPLVRAGPGGYYVEIDGEAIRKRRMELGLSIGELAEMIGISRRTLYGYERKMAKASVSAAYNLIWTLGIPVVKPIDVFVKAERKSRSFLKTARHVIVKHKLLRKILMKLAGREIAAVSTRKAPFDFIIKVHEEIKIVGGVADAKEENVERRIEEIKSFSDIVRAHPVFVTEDKKKVKEDIPLICSKDLSKIRKPEDFVNF
ncbi:helix-turn-helix domain-containing protein [Candidatus Bathyarchaeota archaeon]|nr:helix-turn-helix domain-containing protein [Candidatus Bathyarchaeota archaeon]